ncbi:MAG: hypothetical protein CMJ64_09435 [Planctomycetaceae bacterium]|nr:hypothetical protein [Planctomycetaceae bacterium]
MLLNVFRSDNLFGWLRRSDCVPCVRIVRRGGKLFEQIVVGSCRHNSTRTTSLWPHTVAT